MGAEVGERRRPAAKFLRNSPRLQGAQPHPQPLRRLTDRLKQVDQARRARQIPAPGGDLNARDYQLPVALRRQAAGLCRRRLQGQGADWAPGIGDDAVGAEVGAPVLHLQHGPGAGGQPPGGQHLKPAAAQGLVQADQRLPLPGGLLQQIQEPHPVPCPGNQVNIQGADLLRPGLGVAAADRYHGLGAALSRPADHLPGFFVADGSDGAGVDNIGVRLRLKGDHLVPPDRQLPLHGLGLILVDLTAQRIDPDFHPLPFLLSNYPNHLLDGLCRRIGATPL